MTPRFLDRFPDYCSLLLLGPPGVGKLEYLVAAAQTYLDAGQAVVFVCVDVSPTEVLQPGRTGENGLSRHLGKTLLFVDCYSASLADQVVPDSEGVVLVSSLSNLEGIGMAITKAVARLPAPVKVLFYTISTLFLHNSGQSLSKFFQIVAARAKTQMGLILFACQQGFAEDRQERVLRSLVDGVLEARFNEAMEREIRLHHLRGQTVEATWVPLTDGKEVSATADGGGEEP